MGSDQSHAILSVGTYRPPAEIQWVSLGIALTLAASANKVSVAGVPEGLSPWHSGPPSTLQLSWPPLGSLDADLWNLSGMPYLAPA